ncbi:Importin-11 like protein [Verticillium longisporum]|nr:Importin-11 like protein [Verticillium longisporum]
MAKTAIVAVFSALVTSMGTESQRFHPLMVPLITEVAHPTSELHTSLIDDVLDLWNSILSQSNPPVSTEIVSIAPLLLPILEYSPETAGMALEAVEAYIILAPGAVLEDTLRRPFLTALSGALEVKSREQVNAATRCIEYLIRAAEEYGGANGVSVVIQDMLETGFLKKVLERLHDAWEAHQTTGPNKKSPKLNTVTEGDYFAILARLAYADPTLFANMLASFGDVQQQVWPWLTTEWFFYMESWDRIEHKKLTLLGLTRLTELPNPVQDLALGKLQDYMSLWADTIAELQDGAVDGSDNLVWAEQEGDEWDTPKSIRARELYQSDPLHRVVAKQFVMERVRDLVQRAGGEQKFQDEWMVNVDKEVVQKFAQFVSS